MLHSGTIQGSHLLWIPCCDLHHGLGLDGMKGIVLTEELSARPVISMVSFDCDVAEVLAASIVVVDSSCGSTQDLTNFIALATC